jgi:hypothetical protein
VDDEQPLALVTEGAGDVGRAATIGMVPLGRYGSVDGVGRVSHSPCPTTPATSPASTSRCPVGPSSPGSDRPIAVVSEALIDLVASASRGITAATGGAPFNAARACARLGAPVDLVAAVSTDRFNHRLIADLTTDAVCTEQVQRVDHRPPWPWSS